MLEAQCGQSWELKTPGGPTNRGAPFFCSFTSKCSNRFSQQISEKFPLMFLAGGREKFCSEPKNAIGKGKLTLFYHSVQMFSVWD